MCGDWKLVKSVRCKRMNRMNIRAAELFCIRLDKIDALSLDLNRINGNVRLKTGNFHRDRACPAPDIVDDRLFL